MGSDQRALLQVHLTLASSDIFISVFNTENFNDQKLVFTCVKKNHVQFKTKNSILRFHLDRYCAQLLRESLAYPCIRDMSMSDMRSCVDR